MNIDSHFETYPYYCQWTDSHVGICSLPSTGKPIDLRIVETTAGYYTVQIRQRCSVVDAVCDAWHDYATAVCHADDRPCFVWRK